MRVLLTTVCLVGMLVGLGKTGQAQAALQTDLQFLGLTEDLTQLAVLERWTETTTQTPHCEIRLYRRGQWEPVQQVSPQADPGNPATYSAACQALTADYKKAGRLTDIHWTAATMHPTPPPIKDKAGQLLNGLETMETAYPAEQTYAFTLSTGEHWQVVVQSGTTPNAFEVAYGRLDTARLGKPAYRMVFRPTLEPVPYDTQSGHYTSPQVLLSPLKLMTSAYYRVMVLMFRAVHKGVGGLDIHYHPYLMKWPTYTVMTVEEAKETLNKATAYFMAPSDLEKTGNTFHPPYRAYLRLRTERLPLADLTAEMDRASIAGKLYWLGLLHDQAPERYLPMADRVLSEASPAVQVIELVDEAWQSQNLADLLKQQAQQFARAAP